MTISGLGLAMREALDYAEWRVSMRALGCAERDLTVIADDLARAATLHPLSALRTAAQRFIAEGVPPQELPWALRERLGLAPLSDMETFALRLDFFFAGLLTDWDRWWG